MLSVIIPALNEEAAISATITSLREALRQRGIEHEIIVIDDGSTDRTGELAQAAGARVIRHPQPGGYGKSLKEGIREARYELIGITDADGTYPCDRLPDLYEMVARGGYDMAVGARTGVHYRGGPIKTPARWVFLWLSQYASGTHIPDVNSGLRVFRKELATRFQHTISPGFSFTTTITLAALLNHYFVKYVPIDYHQRVGTSHVRYARDTRRALQILVENILYYNPLKLFLLVTNILLLVAVGAGIVWLISHNPKITFLAAMLASVSFVGAILVSAIGLAGDLLRMSRRER